MSDTVTKTGQLPSLGHLAKRALFWFAPIFAFETIETIARTSVAIRQVSW